MRKEKKKKMGYDSLGFPKLPLILFYSGQLQNGEGRAPDNVNETWSDVSQARVMIRRKLFKQAGLIAWSSTNSELKLEM